MNIKTPKDGDYRYVTKFLWFPKRFDGEWVWLEAVTVRQTYFYRQGWYDVCRSNPLTGYPIYFPQDKSDKFLDQDMTEVGKYYCYYEGNFGRPMMKVIKR